MSAAQTGRISLIWYAATGKPRRRRGKAPDAPSSGSGREALGLDVPALRPRRHDPITVAIHPASREQGDRHQQAAVAREVQGKAVRLEVVPVREIPVLLRGPQQEVEGSSRVAEARR